MEEEELFCEFCGTRLEPVNDPGAWALYEHDNWCERCGHSRRGVESAEDSVLARHRREQAAKGGK